jgi:Rrf2 family nitric oxide-sensitive transcriptional repressor
MRLTFHTDFSLRVLMYLAVHPERLATIAELAAAYGISKNHLMKVVYQLGLMGYVETVRGKHGGVRLARPAAEIVVGELVRRTEPDMALVPCFEAADASCVITPACKLRRALHEARAAFLAVLDGYTVADLVENRTLLRELLANGPAAGAEVAAEPALADE